MEGVGRGRNRPGSMHSPTFFSDITSDWVDRLAAGIIMQAVKDLEYLERSGREILFASGFTETRESLRAWLDSKWCADLLLRTAYDNEWLKRKIKERERIWKQ